MPIALGPGKRIVIGLLAFVAILVWFRSGGRQPSRFFPVKSSFVISKVRYGYSVEANREIWISSYGCGGISAPTIWGSTERYRMVAWERDTSGSDRVFQTYDLLTERMELTSVRAPSGTPGWKCSGMYQQEPTKKAGSKGKMNQPEMRLEGKWKHITQHSLGSLISAGGPFKIQKWSYDLYSGDLVIVMNGQEMLRQRVNDLSNFEIGQKFCSLPDHDLVVYMDGLPGEHGTAWFLDLTLGHPKPPQGLGELFPGRTNTLPTVDFIEVWRPGARKPTTSTGEDKIELGTPYLYKLGAHDPDLDFGDAVTSYQVDFGDGRPLTTKIPEVRHIHTRSGYYSYKVRASDKSGEFGPWAYIGGHAGESTWDKPLPP